MKQTFTVLAIDTSCDETSAAVVRGTTVLSNIQPSQMEYHAQYGGVVPNLARLAHQERIDNVIQEALKRSRCDWDAIDAVAVTEGPGLAIALEVGIRAAISYATKYKKPLLPINHMEGHLLSCFAQRNSKQRQVVSIKTPSLGILVSGGHTEFIRVDAIGSYQKIGETLDDSCGECLDKCGRMLGLGYPAGPTVSQFAKEARSEVAISQFNRHQGRYVQGKIKATEHTFELPVAMSKSDSFNVSYSGLKTAFRQLVDALTQSYNEVNSAQNMLARDIQRAEGLSAKTIKQLCVILESAAYAPLEMRLHQILQKFPEIQEVWLGGGVIASARLRSVLRKTAREYDKPVRYPYGKKLTTDNAAMIGIVATLRSKHNPIEPNPTIDRDPSLEL